MLTLSGAPGRVMAGPNSHTSTRFMDFVNAWILI